MRRIISIITSSAASRILNIVLVFYLYSISTNLLAEFAQSFAIMQLSMMAFKFGGGPKVYRAAITSSENGLISMNKHNYVLAACLIPLGILFTFNVDYTLEILAGYSMAFISTRSVFLVARKTPTIGMALEFLIPAFCILCFVVIFNIFNFALVLFLSSLPSLFTIIIFNFHMSGQFKVRNWTRKDFLSSTQFTWIALTQQLNTNFAILIFAYFFEPSMVAYLRITQTLVAPLLIVNSSFATEFQRRYTLQNFFIDNKFKIYFIFSSLAVLFIEVLIFYHWSLVEAWFGLEALPSESLNFFLIFGVLNFIRILFMFPDTALIAHKREDLISIIYFCTAVFCLFFGALAGYFSNLILTFVILNCAPLIIAIACYITQKRVN
mgnify:CR=1 FL=1